MKLADLLETEEDHLGDMMHRHRKVPTERDIGKLLNSIDPRDHSDSPLAYEARFKEWDLDLHERNLYYVTQETDAHESMEAAEVLADVFKKNGYYGWTIHVVIRDDYRGMESPWETAKS